MKYTHTVRTVFRNATRHGTSVNGNPTYDIHTDAGTYRTATDSSAGYSADNHNHTRLGSVGCEVLLTLTRAGRVVGIERVADAPSYCERYTHEFDYTGTECVRRGCGHVQPNAFTARD